MSGRRKARKSIAGCSRGPGRCRRCSAPIILGPLSPELGYFVQADRARSPLTSRRCLQAGRFVQASARSTTRTGATSRRSCSSASARRGGTRAPNADRPNSGGEQVNLAPAFGQARDQGGRVRLRRAAALHARQRLPAGAEGQVLARAAVSPLATSSSGVTTRSSVAMSIVVRPSPFVAKTRRPDGRKLG